MDGQRHLTPSRKSSYRVEQNKPDYLTFQPSLWNLHKITHLTLVAHKQIRRQKRNVRLH